ncbi:MAG: hypothetical protein P4L84_09130 [Isosphaeraceae bacterium]|nr:hypothetical protein [Isosphaeraceae bacterium]
MQCIGDHLEHDLQILENMMVPEPEHAKTFGVQPPRPDLVVFSPPRVLPTVEFHYQSTLVTEEIGHAGPNGNLPAKPKATEVSLAHVIPQPLFGFRQILP